MATRPMAQLLSYYDEPMSPITKAKNVLTDDGQNLQDILSDRKEDMMTPIIENSSSMFKVGQGDNVDYSENVVDGAYESCVLKGRSLVNILNNPIQTLSGGNSGWKRLNPRWTLKANTKYFALYFVNSNTLDGTIKDVFKYGDDQTTWGIDVVPIGGVGVFKRTFTLSSEVTEYNCYTDTSTIGSANVKCVLLEYQEGMEDLDIPYFEGLCDVKSPILTNVGKNLLPPQLLHSAIIESKQWGGVNFSYNHHDGSFTAKGTFTQDVTLHGNAEEFIKLLKHGSTYQSSPQLLFEVVSLNGDIKWTNNFTFDKNNHVRVSPYYQWLGVEGTTINEIYYPQIEEGSVATDYEQYKSNTLSANGDKIELTEDMLEQGGFSVGGMELPTYEQCKTSTNNTIRIRSKELIKVSPNTTYIVVNKTLNLNYTTYAFNSSKRFTGEVSTTNALSFTTPPSCQYIAIMFSKGNNSTVVTSDFKESEFQIYEVDKTIVLRSLPNGVCDTLNVETGEYVQRIKEIVLDGSSDESWVKNTSLSDNNYTILHNTGYTGMKVETHILVGNMNCDKFKNEWYAIDSGESVSRYANGTEIVLKISTSKLTTQDTTGLRTYLQSNPITVQYELQTPITKTVNLSGYPFAYKNGHVQLSSGSIEQSLTPTIEYSVATNRNGQIRSNQKMVERHQKELDRLQAMILANLVNTQYEQTLTALQYELSRV